MTVRITYEHELEELNKDLREMAFMVEKAIEQTFVAFEDQNYTLAEDVIKGDRTVNDMERAIESRCLSDPAPTARSLRPAPDFHRFKGGYGSGAYRRSCFRYSRADLED